MSKLAITLLLAVLSASSVGCFKMSGDAEALRNSLMKSAAAEWEQEIEIGLGGLTLNLARAGLSFVDLDGDARAALHAVRGADVGIYQLKHGRKSLDHVLLLSNADIAMTDRGWHRFVTVANRHEMVAIYLPKEVRSARNVKVCLVVLDKGQMIVASARSDLEPLLKIALDRKILPRFISDRKSKENGARLSSAAEGKRNGVGKFESIAVGEDSPALCRERADEAAN